MTNSLDSRTAEPHIRSERRYWRRSEESQSWWPGGLLPLILLLLLYLFGAAYCAPRMQADIENEVSTRLTANDVTVSNIDASGQGVAVRASGPADQERRIHALARSTECATWIGRLVCPNKVELELDKTPPAKVAVVAPVAKPVVAQSRHHDFVFEVADKAVTLSGEVPDNVQRQRIVSLANERFSSVTDNLRISNEQAMQQYPLASERALAVLSKLTRGRATWRSGVFDASGTAESEESAKIARSQFSASQGRPRLGRIEVQIAPDRRRCNEEFANALSESTIRFRTSSAAIDEGNEVLLAKLAELASECPGNLTIEGHTDSRGDDEMNQNLSLGRAASVREALIALGVDGARLTSRGFGEMKPIASNETSAGRAKNRRIVISSNETN